MRVLVTGAEGMIGSQLVRGLVDAGYGVISACRMVCLHLLYIL